VQYLKTAFANDTFGRNQRENVSEQAARHNAIFAVNGDYYGYRDTGHIIRNGTLYRDKPKREEIGPDARRLDADR
jgi:exopolysaccharide biosynthesis protein